MIKLCCDCEWYMPGIGHASNEMQAKFAKCARTKTISVVHPQLIPPEYTHCETERKFKTDTSCGPDAKYFVWADQRTEADRQLDAREDDELRAGDHA